MHPTSIYLVLTRILVQEVGQICVKEVLARFHKKIIMKLF